MLVCPALQILPERLSIIYHIVMDHLPFVKLFSGSLENLSPKIFKIVTKLQDYNFKVTWCAGKRHLFCDSLGRIPQFDSWEGFDPLTGDEGDLEDGGMFGKEHTANNVTHLGH